MALDLSLQVGRDTAKIIGQPPPQKSVDKFYEVKYPLKKISTPYFEKVIGRPLSKNTHISQGSRLDYNPNYKSLEKRSAATHIGNSPRNLTPELGEEGKRQALERRKQFKVFQDSLREEEIEKESPKAKFKKQGVCFPNLTGRDSPIIGTVSPMVTKPSLVPLDQLYSQLSKKVPGGAVGKAGMQTHSRPADQRRYDPKYHRVEPNVPSPVNLARHSGRDRNHEIGAAGVTPSINREQLNMLLKKVDRMTKSSISPLEHENDLLNGTFDFRNGTDFYLGGGRNEISVDGTIPEAHIQVADCVADVENQSERLRIQLSYLEKKEEADRKRLQKRQKFGMNTSQMFNYRLSDDYKLRKHYRIYQDRELIKLQEELNAFNPDKVNMGGSMYRISMSAHKKEASREETAQKIAKAATAQPHLTEPNDELEDI